MWAIHTSTTSTFQCEYCQRLTKDAIKFKLKSTSHWNFKKHDPNSIDFERGKRPLPTLSLPKRKFPREDISLKSTVFVCRSIVIAHCLTQAKEFKIGDQPRARQV